MKYSLYAFCDGTFLSSDKCGSKKELANAFKDAFSHYVGRLPTKDKVADFLRTRKAVAFDKSLVYDFAY